MHLEKAMLETKASYFLCQTMDILVDIMMQAEACITCVGLVVV